MTPAGQEGGTPQTQTSSAVLQRIARLNPKLIDLGLDRIRVLLDRLGNPERVLPPVIHVAGTNGKGSTVAFMRAILEAHGASVHAITSPHLVRFHERIVLNGAEIADAELARVLSEAESAAQDLTITYFELITAASLLACARHSADFLLLEVGLGGRLDATNVVERPAMTVITPVNYDHQRFLGTTLTQIAGEKAGILKHGVPCMIGQQEDEAFAVIEEKARALEAPLQVYGQDFRTFEEHGRLVYQDEEALLDLPMPALIGAHQVHNAGVAIAALRAIPGLDLPEADIAQGLQAARWPARCQRLNDGPLILRMQSALGSDADGGELWLDGAHNPHGAQALAQVMAGLEERVSRPLYLILGMVGERNAADYLAAFQGLARHVVTVRVPGIDKARDPLELAREARTDALPASAAEDVGEAMGRVLQMAREDGEPVPRVVICGSLYLAGFILQTHS